jgi:hypothetical protein
VHNDAPLSFYGADSYALKLTKIRTIRAPNAVHAPVIIDAVINREINLLEL